MATIASLMVKIGADIADMKKSMSDAQKLVNQAADGMKNAGKVLTLGVTAPILAAGAAAFKMASDFNESQNKVDVAFGYMSSDVEEWSKTTLKSFGLAQGTALDMAAAFGDMGTSMGLSKSAAAEMSKQMVGLAGDMASFKNMSIGEVNTALTAVFTGETESLKRMGIVMTQVNLEQYAMSQGIKTAIKDMSQAELTTLRYNYVLANTANAQGDFERTGGGAANQMRILTESIKETAAKIGQNLIPVITPIIKQFGEWVQKFGEMNPEAQKTALVVAAIAAAIGPLLIVVGNGIKVFATVKTAITAITAAQAAWNVAMLANPIGLVIAGVAALVAIIAVLAVQYNKAKDAEQAMYDKMREDNKKAYEEEKTRIQDTYSAQLTAIDDKIAAESSYTQEIMALNQKQYDDELAKGQSVLDVMKKNLSDRQKALDDQHDAAIDAINGEYGVYEAVHKSKLDLINEEQEKAVQAQKDIFTAAEEAYNKNIEMLREEYGVFEEQQKSMVDLAKEIAAEKIDSLNDYFAEEKEKTEASKKLIEERYKEEVEAAKEAHKERLGLLDDEYQKKLDIIDLGLSEEVRAIRDQIDAIDGLTKAEEKALQDQRNAEKIAMLESKIALETDVEERLKLQKELQEEIAKQAREKLLEARELEKATLEDRIKDAETRAKEEKKAAKDQHDEEKRLLEESHKAELDTLEEIKTSTLEAEDKKLEKIKERVTGQITQIEESLTEELRAINAARIEKEEAEKAKFDAVKESTDAEIIRINEAAEEAKIQNEAIRKAKEEAENAKYLAAKKSLDDEETYLSDWIESSYKPALDAKLKAANEKETERHNLIMANLETERAQTERNMNAAFTANENMYKIRELDVQIQEKQAEVDKYKEGYNQGMVSSYDVAAKERELQQLKQERAYLTNGSSGLSGGVSGISSYAVGTPYVPYDQLAYIHKGEAVVPAAENRRGTGYKTANIYLEIDGRTLVRAIGQPLADEIRSRTGIKI